MSVVERAEGAAGCLDFAITAAVIDSGHANIFERWQSQAALETFRSSDPDTEQRPPMLRVSVQERERPPREKGQA